MWPMGPFQVPSKTLPMSGCASTFEDEEMPLAIEPIIAWRCWELETHERRGLFLRSVTYRMRWPRMVPTHAHCYSQLRPWLNQAWPKITDPKLRVETHESPNRKHRCGLYAVKTHEQAQEWAMVPALSRDRVIGTVKLWGKVYKFTHGYLAEYAYPASLLIHKPLYGDVGQELEERYGIPVFWLPEKAQEAA